MTSIKNLDKISNIFIETIGEIRNIPDTDLAKVSSIIHNKMLNIGKLILEAWLDEKIGSGYHGSTLAIDNDNGNNIYYYNGDVEKVYLTILGNVSFKRAYYYNEKNHCGKYPIEEKYPILKDVFFPEVKELICYCCSIEPYDTAKEMLYRIAKLKISSSSLQRVTKQVGGYLVKEEDERVVKPQKYKESERRIDLMCISMDGTMINTHDGWKEVKNGVIFEIKKENGKSKSINKSFISRIENYIDFSKRIKEEARRRHYLNADRLVVIGDGAHWIWDIAEKNFPNCIEIVDWYHATEHLWNITEYIYGSRDNPEGVIFEKRCEDFLYNGLLGLLEEEIKDKIKLNKIKENSDRYKLIISEVQYFKRNEKRMRYEYFERNNLPIGSGEVEGACKHLVQIRLKRNGMRWKKEGAHCILQLRCHYLSKRWNKVKEIIESAAA